ncbi:MAG: hypothetical protein Q8Q09_23895 [Deltaproteobacteria bacterium]|nr:hypothetical protein [Deltaproteobacteria bacterium]
MPRTESLHPLRFVRALALLGALPACEVRADEMAPLPPGGSSGGVVLVQGSVAQGNHNEADVEMRTVATGQQQAMVVQPSPDCPLGQSIGCRPGEVAVCVATSAGGAWQCQPPAGPTACVVGQSRPGPRGGCTCFETIRGPEWTCEMESRRVVGPLPPPELPA